MFFLVTFVACASAWAVEVEPTRLELKVTPDQPITGELKISNKGRNAVEVRISAGPYRFADPSLNLPSCERWLRFTPDRLTLAGGASTSVAYTVTPPDNVEADTAGEYFGAVLVDQHPAEPEQPAPGANAKLTIVPRLALAVYVVVQGKEKIEVELDKLSAEKLDSAVKGTGGREATTDLLKMDVLLKNRGTVHVRPSGTYALFQEDGKLYHAASLGKSMPLLPSASMAIPALLPMPPAGKYRWVVTVEAQEGTVLQKETPLEVTEEGEVVVKEKLG